MADLVDALLAHAGDADDVAYRACCTASPESSGEHHAGAPGCAGRDAARGAARRRGPGRRHPPRGASYGDAVVGPAAHGRGDAHLGARRRSSRPGRSRSPSGRGRWPATRRSTDGWLEHLYVEPAAQGRGLGSALFAHEQALQPRGFRFWVFLALHHRPGVLRAPRLRGGAAHHRRGQRGARARRVPQVGAAGLTPGSALAGGRLRPGDLGASCSARGSRSGSPTTVAARGRRPGPAWSALQLGHHRRRACRRRARRGRRGWRGPCTCRTAVDLVEHDLDLAAAHALLRRSGRGRPRRPARRDSPRSRPRSRSSSRTTTTSKCWAATAPSSRMSSSRRSPAVAIMPIRESLPRSVWPGLLRRRSARRSRRAPACRGRCGSSRR